MLKAAYIADSHICAQHFESESLFPAYIQRFPARERQRAYDGIRTVIDACHDAVLEELGKTPADFAIHFGDLCGGWRGRGIGYGNLPQLVGGVIGMYQSIWGTFHIAWGNHDVGYEDWIVDPVSLAACAELSPLFWSYGPEEMLFLGVCEPLLRAHKGESREVTRTREAQADFVADTLRRNAGRPWILCGHSADIGGLGKQAGPYLPTLRRYMFGDRHIAWVGACENYLGYAMGGFEGACRRKSVMCPSIAPLWWRGGAYMRGVIEGDSMRLQPHMVAYAPELAERVRRMPFSKMLRSYRFMMQRRAGF